MEVSPLLLAAMIAVVDVALPAQRTVVGLFVLVPLVSQIIPSAPRPTAMTGLITLAICLPVAAERWQSRPLPAVTSILGVGVVSMATLHQARRHLRDRQRAAQVNETLTALQRVLLRPLPRRLGALGLRSSYLAAAPRAGVGGDVYEALCTPFGIRVLLGDVMGKGLGTIAHAGILLGSFREAAYEEADLVDLSWRLHVSLVRSDPGVFATAALLTVSYDGRRAEILSCGHPAPLLIDGETGVLQIPIPRPCPPLGLLDYCTDHHPADIEIRPGQHLLLYTDGVSDARDDHDVEFPLRDHVERFADRPPESLIEALTDRLRAHVHSAGSDDAALLLLSPEPPVEGSMADGRDLRGEALT